MIHNWTEQTMVRPRSAALIEDKGTFVSNYICIRPAKDVQMYPVAYCNGEESKVSFNSILYGHEEIISGYRFKSRLEWRETVRQR